MAQDRQNDSLAQLLRRQFSDEKMRRHLRSLPLFKVDRWLPDRLRELLDRLARNKRNNRTP